MWMLKTTRKKTTEMMMTTRWKMKKKEKTNPTPHLTEMKVGIKNTLGVVYLHLQRLVYPNG